MSRYQNYCEVSLEDDHGIFGVGLVQNYIPGVSLQEILDQRKTFSEQRIRFIATEVLKILIYLHRLYPPVLYLDIKPSNLILGENKQIDLIDFGAVQNQNNITKLTLTIVGANGSTPLEHFFTKQFLHPIYTL
ncbi:MAG: protein kinase domain-containing protein [cyanobacterium endosymbiont of Rhopalodia sterrenbergii]